MKKKTEIRWTVIRDYKNLCSLEELIHRIIRVRLELSEMR